MKFSNLASSPSVGWLEAPGNKEPSYISARIRLARNLSGFPFPMTANEEQLKEVRKKVFSAVSEVSLLKKAEKIKLEECSELDKKFLIERHLISYQHSGKSRIAGLIFDEKEQVSIMVNEEDHLRIQFISGGLDLFEAWDIINRLDDELSKILEFEYSERWGYMTSCPTNTGTGMRVSSQIHLPAIGMTGGLSGTMEDINKMGMVVRGLYGEGTRVMGNILQISNQVTLGISERRIIDSLTRLAKQVAEREKKAAAMILDKDPEGIKDSVFRSQGLLINAYKITFEEALDLMSNLRFGIYTKLLKSDIDVLNNLMIRIQPAHIQQAGGSKLNDLELDVARAHLIKKDLKVSNI
ncbi:MAG: protein arginine kinase [Elusimicrobia bacterium]|nr:protein arginine kinase [Elusimicrobiota bacterium]